jgi:hypothetical protein
MNLYTVHMPPHAGTDSVPHGHVRLVKEGFAWGAFFFGPIWLVLDRLWIATLGWLVAAALAVGGFVSGLYSAGALAGLLFLLCLITGLEGYDLLRRKLVRAGADLCGIVTGGDVETAEYRCFARMSLSDAAPAMPAGAGSRPVRPVYATPLVGVFPTEEERR